MSGIYIFLFFAFLISLLIINGIVTTAANAISKAIIHKITIELTALYEKFHAELDEIDQQMREYADITEPNTKDKLLYDVAIWAIKCNGLSTSAVQRHFSTSFRRAGKIVDQLYSMGICGAATGSAKPRPILVTMGDVIELKAHGAFET